MLIQARERPRAEIFPLHSLRFTDLRESNPVTIPATPLFYDGFTATQITCETPVEMTYMLKLGNSWQEIILSFLKDKHLPIHK